MGSFVWAIACNLNRPAANDYPSRGSYNVWSRLGCAVEVRTYTVRDRGLVLVLRIDGLLTDESIALMTFLHAEFAITDCTRYVRGALHCFNDSQCRGYSIMASLRLLGDVRCYNVPTASPTSSRRQFVCLYLSKS